MFGSHTRQDTNPFVVLCSFIGFHVVCSAFLLIDFIKV